MSRREGDNKSDSKNASAEQSTEEDTEEEMYIPPEWVKRVHVEFAKLYAEEKIRRADAIRDLWMKNR